jgi:phosphoribosylformimino-5-aminoimidazole carboxamide ribotide isomerase
VIIYPAIDLKGGACVRLVRGDMAKATVFSNDPPGQARYFASLGFEWLHVVDLDGAFAGHSVNGNVVRAIRAAVPIKVQLGGGIRDRAAVDHWLRLGIDRVILSTAALRDPDLVRRAAADYPDRIVVGIDARNGRAAIEGWAQGSTIQAVDLARRFVGSGVAAIAYTDIARDGALSGMNVPAVVNFAKQAGMPVIAAGGIAGPGDIAALAAHEHDGIAGAICGRALYEGRLDPREALRLAAGAGAGAGAGAAGGVAAPC